MAVEIEGVAHVNVNCRDLARSTAFYRETLGLDVAAHTRPDRPQDGSGFGLPGDAQWDAHMLVQPGAAPGPAVDLLQWLVPEPVGAPPERLDQLGFGRVAFVTPDLAGHYEALRAQGVSCLSPPRDVPLDSGIAESVRVVCFRDPDGTVLQLIERPVPTVDFAHVNVNCSNLARSQGWYERVLGLDTLGKSAPGPVAGDVYGLPGEVEWDARFLVPAQGPSLVVNLMEWKRPQPTGSPAARANQLGIFRMAFLVADAAKARTELVRCGVDAPPPTFLEMGPDIPVPGVWAVFFRDPDGACLELIQSPV